MEPDIFINRLLDALQRQDVVAPGLRDPLRRVPLTIIAWAGNIMPTTVEKIHDRQHRRDLVRLAVLPDLA